MEAYILLWIQEHIRCDFLNTFFIFITTLGNGGLIWIGLVLFLIFMKKTRKQGIIAAVSLALTCVINNLLIKNIFDRIRPYEVVEGLEILIEKQKDFSFPSGHTAVAFGTAVVFFMLFPRKYGIPVLILAILMGISRVYVGVHYPTDVICGMMIGTAVAIVVVQSARRYEKKRCDK